MFKRVFGLLIAISLVLTTGAISTAQPLVPDATPASSANPRDKIHPNLLRDIDQALEVQSRPSPQARRRAPTLPFLARVVAGTDLSPYATEWFARPFVDPFGNTVAIGKATPNALIKMASLPNVIQVQRPESLIDPPQLPQPEIAGALNTTIEARISTKPGPGPAPTGWFHTGSAIHGSQDAWAKGYTGKGVRFMSNDSGADYCHPDLFGTWAYINDPASPYYGLPQMYDSWSSYIAANDYYLGTSLIAEGFADYADTSTKIEAPTSIQWRRAPADRKTAEYQPLGAPEARTYRLPGTSVSGSYRIGYHPDTSLAEVAPLLNNAFGDGSIREAERAAVLVVDSRRAGVYDMVYVDLNYNFDFTDDEPARLFRGERRIDLARRFGNREAACLDYNGDGLNDVSGGLVYYIADGKTSVPTHDWQWGIPGEAFGNGELVAFHVMDYLEPGGDHGMGTTSVAVGQGRVRGSVFSGPSGPPQAGGRGLVVGPGKDMRTTQNGNFYISPFVEDGFLYATLGYDGVPNSGDTTQIVNNSWGDSSIDNDGFDYGSRLIDIINREFGPNSAFLIATGNGAPGYGTVAPPSPPSGIGVGASTLYDSVGLFEPIESAEQIVGGDIISWSNRGPGARNTVGVHVVATGAWGTGSVALNQVLDGSVATAIFGGTSMAAPVAGGNLALIYQAWRERTGEWPTFEEARAVLMGSARNINYDVWSQGAGMVNGDQGTDIAAGRSGVYATPAEWSVGDYRGEQYPAFANIIAPGESSTQTFTLWNHSDRPQAVSISTSRFTRIGSKDYSFTSLDVSLDHGAFTVPDYVLRIDSDIPRDTDLLEVKVSRPYEQFDPDGTLVGPFNNWQVLLYNWTDLNGNGAFWTDADSSGKVTAELDDFGEVVETEMEVGEYIRFTSGDNIGPTQQARVGAPLERKADGILLGLRHNGILDEVANTDLQIEASFWQRTEWDWISISNSRRTVPPRNQATFDATLRVPEETPYGMYEGALTIHDGAREIIIPVTVAVAASGTRFSFGGGEPADNLYANNAVFGYTDYAWDAESGDWRFFWTDIMAADLPEQGTSYLVVDTAWEGAGTDIDTLVVGPVPSFIPPVVAGEEAVPYPEEIYGPYTLEEVGRSVYTHLGSGRWPFQTATGGPREIIAAPVQEGLHGIFLHQVKVDGNRIAEPFRGAAGLVTLAPGVLAGSELRGTATITLSSELAFGAFVAQGFGLSQPETTRETARQDDPSDPFSASVVRTVEIENGALLEVTTANSASGSDIDLFVYGPDGSLVGASTRPDDQERVVVQFPADGTYTIAVQGWNVPTGTDPFDLTINAIQGTDLVVTDLPEEVPVDGSVRITVAWDASGKAPGIYNGLLLMGPEEAPGLLQVPVEVTVE